ncbi:putative chitin binding [Diaporthe ampelina]|uniref:Putative chitin binding n=1 Tax=Diaporthe ampelina TaxID=1214573 RepID=A0A0G2FI12_9PEZI|nr:putative chitin binding [Diaporthe ampelina]
MYKQISAAALFAAGVSAHGRVTSPTPRPLGDAMKAACGNQVWNMQSSDSNGNIQTMAQIGTSQSDFDATKCHLWQCRGYQFDDATADSIQSFTAGQEVPFVVDVAAPHTGVANVSVIDLGANSVIGDALISWDSYASTATGVQPGDENFSVTIPSDLPATCATKGGCALQWWWDAREIDQTYMSCVDFVVGGASGSGSASSSSAAPAATTTTAAATTSSVPAAAAAAEPTAAAESDDSSTCTKRRKTRRAFRA